VAKSCSPSFPYSRLVERAMLGDDLDVAAAHDIARYPAELDTADRQEPTANEEAYGQCAPGRR
jgi:hypothetical protein